MVGVEVDCAGRNLLVLNVVIDFGLVFCLRAENASFLVWGSMDLVFVWVVEIDLVFVCRQEITWFSCEHRT